MKFWFYVGIPITIIGTFVALHYFDTTGDVFFLLLLLAALYSYLDSRTKQKESLRKEEGQIIGFFTALALDETFCSSIADDILNFSLQELHQLRKSHSGPLCGKDHPEFCLLCIEKFVEERSTWSDSINQQLLDFCQKHRNEARHLTYYIHERR